VYCLEVVMRVSQVRFELRKLKPYMCVNPKEDHNE